MIRAVLCLAVAGGVWLEAGFASAGNVSAKYEIPHVSVNPENVIVFDLPVDIERGPPCRDLRAAERIDVYAMRLVVFHLLLGRKACTTVAGDIALIGQREVELERILLNPSMHPTNDIDRRRLAKVLDAKRNGRRLIEILVLHMRDIHIGAQLTMSYVSRDLNNILGLVQRPLKKDHRPYVSNAPSVKAVRK